jgi:hypothetical protein
MLLGLIWSPAIQTALIEWQGQRNDEAVQTGSRQRLETFGASP